MWTGRLPQSLQDPSEGVELVQCATTRTESNQVMDVREKNRTEPLLSALEGCLVVGESLRPDPFQELDSKTINVFPQTWLIQKGNYINQKIRALQTVETVHYE